MIELTTLKFAVDTSELDRAVNVYDKLTGAVSSFSAAQNKAAKYPIDGVKKLSSLEKTVSQAEAIQKKTDASLIAAKEKSLAKLEALAESSSKKIAQRQEQLNKNELDALEKSTRFIQERSKLILDGYSSGQAAQLARLRLLGVEEATLKRMGDLLRQDRKVTGKNPFDDSEAGSIKILKQLERVKLESRIVKRQLTDDWKATYGEISLTAQQVTDLAIEKQRLIAKASAKGTMKELTAEMPKLERDFVQAAVSLNRFTGGMKDSSTSAKDQARAIKFLEKEMKLLDNTVDLTGDGLSEFAHLRLARFKTALQQSGKAVKEQQAIFETYLNKIKMQEQSLKTSRASAYVAPQVTDIVTSLAGGQNPFLVLLQQGGQLRDGFQNIGIASKDMAATIIQSMRSMGETITGVGKALVTVFVQGVKMATLAVTDFVLKALPVNKLFTSMAEGAGFSEAAVARLNNIVRGFAAGSILILVAALVIVTKEFWNVMKASTELSANLIQFGGNAGYTRDQLVGLSQGLKDAGYSTSTILTAMSALVKDGAATRNTILELTRVALDMERYLGVSADKIGDAYKKIAEEPSKALAEFAKQTGLVEASILAQVIAFENAGEKGKAYKLALDSVVEAQKKMIETAEKDLSPLEAFWIGAKKGAVFYFDYIKDKANDVLLGLGYLLKELKFAWDGLAIAAEFAAKFIYTALKNIPTLVFAAMAAIKDFSLKPIQDASVKVLEELKAVTEEMVKKDNERLALNKALKSAEEGKADATRELISLGARYGTQQEDNVRLTSLVNNITKDYTSNLTATAKAERDVAEATKIYNDALKNQTQLKKMVSSSGDPTKNLYDDAKKNLENAKKKLAEAKLAELKKDTTSKPLVSYQTDNVLEETARRYDKLIQLAKNYAKLELDLLKQQKQNLLVEQLEFNTREYSLLQTSSQNQIDLYKKKAEEIAALQKKEKEALDKAFNDNEKTIIRKPIRDDQKVVELNENYKKYSEALAKVNEQYKTQNENISGTITLLEQEMQLRSSAALYSHLKELKEISEAYEKLQEENERYWRDLDRNASQSSKLTWASPKDAAVMQAIYRETNRYVNLIDKLADELKKAQKEVDAFWDSARGDVVTPEFLEAGLRAEKELAERRKNLNSVVAQQRIDEDRAAVDAIIQYEEKERKELADRVSNAIVDAIMTGNAKNLGKALREIIIAELRKPIQIQVQAVVSDLMNGTNSSGAAGGIAGFVRSIIGSTSTPQQGPTQDGSFLPNLPGSGILGGLEKLFPNLSKLVGNVGQLVSSASTIFAGVQIGRAISNGYSLNGKGSGNSTVNAGAVIGTFFGGPIGGAIGAAIGGLINRLFGRKLQDAGFEATFAQSGVTGRSFQFYRGGLFRSDKTQYGEIDSKLLEGLDKTSSAIFGTLGKFADVLGISSDAFKNFTYSIKISTKDLSAAQIEEKIKEEFLKMTQGAVGALNFEKLGTKVRDYVNSLSGSTEEIFNSLQGLVQAQQLLTSKGTTITDVIGEQLDLDKLIELNIEGESLAETLGKLVSSFEITNIIARLQGKTIEQAYGAVGLASKEARDRLIEFAGGIDSLQNGLQFFLENFYTQQERDAMALANAQQSLTSGFGLLNIAIPKTKEEFRNLINSIDTSTEAGAKFYASLLALAPAMVIVDDAAKKARNELNALASITAESISGVFNSILESANSAQEARKLAEEQSAELFYKGLMDTLISSASSALMQAIITPIANSLVISSTTAGVTLVQGGIVASTAISAAGLQLAKIVGIVRTLAEIMKTDEFKEAMNLFVTSMGDVASELFSASRSLRESAESTPTPGWNWGQINDLISSSMDDFRSRLQEAFNVLSRAIAAEKQILDKKLSSLNSLLDTNKSAIKNLLEQVDNASSFEYNEARDFITNTLNLLGTGLLPDIERYQDSVQSALNGIGKTIFASKFEEDRAKLMLAAELEAINQLVEPQKSAVEQQLEYLQGILDNAERQLAAVGANTNSITLLSSAITNWNSTIGQIGTYWNYLTTWIPNAFGPGYSFPSMPGVLQPIPVQPPTPIIQNSLRTSFNEKSTEEKDTGDSELLLELQALRAEVINLRAEVRADVAANQNISNKLDRVTQAGDYIQVKEYIEPSNV